MYCCRTTNGQSFTMTTVKGEEFTFTSNNAEEVCTLINYFLEGLKKRSKFVIATMDYQSPGEQHIYHIQLFCEFIASRCALYFIFRDKFLSFSFFLLCYFLSIQERVVSSWASDEETWSVLKMKKERISHTLAGVTESVRELERKETSLLSVFMCYQHWQSRLMKYLWGLDIMVKPQIEFKLKTKLWSLKLCKATFSIWWGVYICMYINLSLIHSIE